MTETETIRVFKNLPKYLKAHAADPSLAIVSIRDFAPQLGLQRVTIEKHLANGKLEGVRIGNSLYVRARSAAAEIERRENQRKIVENRLIDVALDRTVVAYSEAMSWLNMVSSQSRDRDAFSKVLGKLSRKYHNKHEIIFSVIVVEKGTTMPSEPFFGFAEELTGEAIAKSERAEWCRTQQEMVWNKIADLHG